MAAGAPEGLLWEVQVARPVAAGIVANLAVGTLFGWSLVAGPASADVGAADVGAPAAVGPAIFATAIASSRRRPHRSPTQSWAEAAHCASWVPGGCSPRPP